MRTPGRRPHAPLSPAAVLAAAFLASVALAAPARAADFCASLNDMVKAGDGGFETLKGEADGKDRWKSKATLEGARECTVTASKRDSRLTCSIAWDSDRSVVEPRYTDTKKQVEECLSGWTSADDASTIDPMATIFSKGKSGGKVAVRLTDAGTAFNLTVSVTAKPAGE